MNLHAGALGSRTSSDWMERLARFGFMTKGVVYGLVGILAIQAALSTGGGTEGTQGAIREIASQPFGTVLLALTAVGLLGYAVWRLVSAVVDPENVGGDAGGIVRRLGYLVSGLVYLGLALWAASVAVGADGGSSGSGGSEQEWTARLMSQPFGVWLVGAVGLVIIGVGVHHFRQAHTARFMRYFDRGSLDARKRHWAKRIGQFGLSARGVTFALIGIFLIQAALQSDPSETRGLGGALQSLAEQPYGPWLLGLVALGFIAYGVYCGVRGWTGRLRG